MVGFFDPFTFYAYVFSFAEGVQYLTDPYGTVPSYAYGINNAGQIVGSTGGTNYGYGGLSECIDTCPVVFFQNGTVIPLVPDSYTLVSGQATAINDHYITLSSAASLSLS